MKIYEYGKDRLPKAKRAVALGFFDGVHLGHRKIIGDTVASAKRNSLTSAVFTFFGERGGFKPSAPRIYSTEEKLGIFRTLGVDEVIIADFSKISHISAEDFARELLAGELSAREAHLGYNYRFGRGGTAGADELEALLRSVGARAYIAPEYKFHGMPLSSTEIRRALAAGDIRLAGEMLGAPYRLRGKIEHGRGLGHSLGYPTVNTELSHDCPLRHGVYRTAVEISGRRLLGVTNIGVCPTVGEREMHAETHIIDFSGELYGEECTVFFLDFLRDEIKFSSEAELSERIRLDVEAAKESGLCQDFGQN
ncbi:MAG: riboflavin biosynthesis protein RibF [Clostridia bacterium]|nr:riboflavin biosynthesis protein RibF [Clostridia bacterium]